MNSVARWIVVPSGVLAGGLSLVFGGPVVPAEPPNGVPVPPGLVAWWSGGSETRDRLQQREARLGAGVTETDGVAGSSWHLPKQADGWVELPDDPRFQPASQALTIECWVRPTYRSGPDELDTILRKRDGSGDSFPYNLSILHGHLGYQGNLVFSVGGVTPYPGLLSTKPIPYDGLFHHVAVTFDGTLPAGNCALYLDGEQVGGGDAPGALPLAESAPVIGLHVSDGTYYSDMDLDELAFYDRALSATEIQAIHAAGSAGKVFQPCPAPAGLAAWWTAESTFADRAGSNPLTPRGDVGYGRGIVGQAFNFNGLDLYLEAEPVLRNEGSFSCEWWMQVRRFTHSDYTPVFCQPCQGLGDDCPAGSYWFYTGNETSYGSFRFAALWRDESSLDLHPVLPFGTDTWEHVAVTYDGENVVLYWNGAEFARQSHPGKALGNELPLWLGKAFVPHSDGRHEVSYLDGLIDEFSVYRRALTVEEVRAIHGAGPAGKRPVPPVAQGLVLWLDAGEPTSLPPLEAGANPSVNLWRDLSGQGLDVTPGIYAAPTYLPEALSGRAGVDFSGSGNDALTTVSSATLAVTEATVVLVASRIGQAASFALSAPDYEQEMLLYNGGAYHHERAGVFTTRGHASAPQDLAVVAAYFGPSAAQIDYLVEGVPSDLEVDGNASGVADFAAVPRQALLGSRIGWSNQGSTDGQYDGIIGEVMVFSRRLGPLELDTLHAHFSRKYGLAARPLQPALLLARATDGNLEFLWEAAAGRTYQLQTATDPGSSSWTDQGPPLIPWTSPVRRTEAVPADPARYYRLQPR